MKRYLQRVEFGVPPTTAIAIRKIIEPTTPVKERSRQTPGSELISMRRIDYPWLCAPGFEDLVVPCAEPVGMEAAAGGHWRHSGHDV